MVEWTLILPIRINKMFIKNQKQDETGLRLKEKNIDSYIVLLRKEIWCHTLLDTGFPPGPVTLAATLP